MRRAYTPPQTEIQVGPPVNMTIDLFDYRPAKQDSGSQIAGPGKIPHLHRRRVKGSSRKIRSCDKS